MTKVAELTGKQNGYSFNVELFESDNKLCVSFKVMGWTFASVEFEKSTFSHTCKTTNWNGSCNLWQVAAIFGNKENMVEYARILIA